MIPFALETVHISENLDLCLGRRVSRAVPFQNGFGKTTILLESLSNFSWIGFFLCLIVHYILSHGCAFELDKSYKEEIIEHDYLKEKTLTMNF